MTWAPSTRFGPYEVTSILGAGGMGEVYRARDARLERDVALKVLPATLMVDAERLARFKREATVLASLNSAMGTLVFREGAHHELVSIDRDTGTIRPLSTNLRRFALPAPVARW